MNPGFESMRVENIVRLPSDITTLVLEGEQEGYRFLHRLVKEFADGSNRFNGRGECLLAVKEGGNLVAIGGLNIYDANTARLRRVFVRKQYRNRGIGKALVAALERNAVKCFKEVVLYTDSILAAQFYQSCGYNAANQPNVSHRKLLL